MVFSPCNPLPILRQFSAMTLSTMDIPEPVETARASSSLPRPLRGMIPPMVSPLLDDEALDVAGLERLVEHILGGGVHGLFVLGSTGEGPSLSSRVRRELVAHVCRQVNGRVPVLVGITDNSLAESAALANFAAVAGAQAVVCTAPSYFPAGDLELLNYFKSLNSRLPLPLLLYNMPALTRISFSMDLIRGLMAEENIVGLKDSSGDLNYFQAVREVAADRPGWTLMVGPERLLADAVDLGADGGVSGGANLHPKLLADLYESAAGKDDKRLANVKSDLAKLGRLYQLQPCGNGPPISALKFALSCLGICQDRVAPPLLGFDPSQRAAVEEILDELGLRS
jgi:4-hydroxy-tetrahydrodipicolinate synthase